MVLSLDKINTQLDAHFRALREIRDILNKHCEAPSPEGAFPHGYTEEQWEEISAATREVNKAVQCISDATGHLAEVTP